MMLARTPEPELMDHPDQVDAYASADFAESNQAFVDFLCANFQPRPTQGRLLDLGCGPGDICLRFARALPEWRIEGADAGANMLERARHNRERAALTEHQVQFVHAHLPDTSTLDGPYQAITSNSLLHHLPDPMMLWKTVGKLAGLGTWVQIMDLFRPESHDEVERLVFQYAGSEALVLQQDFANSLKAAWRLDEVRDQLDAAGLELECRAVSDRHWMVSGYPAAR